MTEITPCLKLNKHCISLYGPKCETKPLFLCLLYICLSPLTNRMLVNHGLVRVPLQGQEAMRLSNLFKGGFVGYTQHRIVTPSFNSIHGYHTQKNACWGSPGEALGSRGSRNGCGLMTRFEQKKKNKDRKFTVHFPFACLGPELGVTATNRSPLPQGASALHHGTTLLSRMSCCRAMLYFCRTKLDRLRVMALC